MEMCENIIKSTSKNIEAKNCYLEQSEGYKKNNYTLRFTQSDIKTPNKLNPEKSEE